MKIAIDVSPLISGHYLAHRVRGTGFYINNLKEHLIKYFPKNEYLFFSQGENIPKDVDLIHFPYFEPFFITYPFRKPGKTIITVHDLTPLVFKDKFPSGFKGKIKWLIQKRQLLRADAIITDSISSKDDLINIVKIKPEKIHVVYLAVSDDFKPILSNEKLEAVNKKYNLPEKFLLYVGDATWNKNLPNLIKAINNTDFDLIIVGKAFKNENYDRSNPWNQSLDEAQNLARSNSKIKSLGFLSNQELVALYNLASVFIMPSFYEGFGLPVLEAMQSGLPVLTSAKGSLKEIGKEYVYYVNPNSVESISDGIKDLMNSNELRSKFSKKGIERAKQFSWKKTAKETMSVYEEVYSET